MQLIGADLDAINMAEDRLLFREAMDRIGLESPRSAIAHTIEEALEGLEKVGLPTIIRPSFTMGGTGGGVAYNREEFLAIVESGLDASPATEVLIEESVLGWKEYEMEVVRDSADNCIIICSIENVDPMGLHTGDSITVAPALTLTDREYQIMRNASIAVLREIGVETGGSNVQFAVNPADGRLVVIEMNPRVSRSSALASKATGFPIAKIAAKLAVGYTLDELMNDITGVTPASFEPTIDYVVTKIPRFAFEKFPGAEPLLTTAMKSVGEAMAIGRNFQESLQKALRSLETGLTGLNTPDDAPLADESGDMDELRAALTSATPSRLLMVAHALRQNMSVEEICALSHFDPWFVHQIIRKPWSPRAACPIRPKRCAMSKPWAFPMRGWANWLVWTKTLRARRVTGWTYAPISAVSTLARRNLLPAHPIFIQAMTNPRHLRAKPSPSRRRAKKLSFWAAGRTASAKALSLIIAAAMRRMHWPMPILKALWSTAIRKPSPLTMTPQTAYISSR